jgi:hypothetical protein
MKQKSLVLMACMAFVLALILPVSVTAQQKPERREGRFSLGADIGAQFGTADSTAFALGFNGDYFLTHNFSIGPLLQVGLTDDLFQFGPSLQVKYTYDIDSRLKANLQGGIGFIYAELERRGRDKDDTSFLIPVGPGLEYRLTEDISIGTTVLFNFTNLKDVRDDDFFVSLLGGLRVRF